MIGDGGRGEAVRVMKDPKAWFTISEMKRMLRAAKSRRDKLYMEGLYESARRNGEFLLLTPGDVNYEDKQILFNIFKKHNQPDLRKWKDVKAEYVNKLMRYVWDKGIENDKRIFDFTTRRGRQIVTEVGERSGVSQRKRCHPHAFRHSFAIHFVRGPLKNSGNPIRDLIMLKDYLDHSSLNMTLWYLQYGDEAMRKAITDLPGIS